MQKEYLKHNTWILVKGQMAKLKLDDNYQFYVEIEGGKCAMLGCYKPEEIQPIPRTLTEAEKRKENY